MVLLDILESIKTLKESTRVIALNWKNLWSKSLFKKLNSYSYNYTHVTAEEMFKHIVNITLSNDRTKALVH